VLDVALPLFVDELAESQVEHRVPDLAFGDLATAPLMPIPYRSYMPGSVMFTRFG
jgi:hypothetical protein